MDYEYLDEEDEDIEFSEEDFISEEDIEDEMEEEGEAFAFPFSSIFINKIPEKFNPKILLKEKELILYNPNDRIQPYSRINPALMTFDMLKDNFIVKHITADQNSSLQDFTTFGKILNLGLKPIVASCIEYDRSKEVIDAPNQKNGFKNGFKPKPQGQQGRKRAGRKGKGKQK
jgi:hypothetical protein